jgi:NCS1 family nucleobase:cation symporter-1
VLADTTRRLTPLDIGLLWFAAAVAITEIWAGGLKPLTDLGFGLGLLALLLGRVIGNGLMAGMAYIGSQTGQASILISRTALGMVGSRILGILNVIQLIGWTGWMLFVGALYCDVVAVSLGFRDIESYPPMRFFWILILAILCIVWARGGQTFWRIAQRVSAITLAALCLFMTVIVTQRFDLPTVLSSSAASGIGLLRGVDIVVAMSVSWLPLVADYSRYCVNGRGAALGTFWGYFIGGTWMYATGLLIALAASTSEPDQMVIRVMAEAGLGWALLAVCLVLISTVTTTFLDIFSAVVSSQAILPGVSLRSGSVIAGLLGAACALWLDVFKYQHFLELIGLVFLPAFTVVITDHFTNRSLKSLNRVEHSVVSIPSWPGPLAWLLGAIVYDTSSGGRVVNSLMGIAGTQIELAPWDSGASIPTILASSLGYVILKELSKTFIEQSKQ